MGFTLTDAIQIEIDAILILATFLSNAFIIVDVASLVIGAITILETSDARLRLAYA